MNSSNLLPISYKCNMVCHISGDIQDFLLQNLSGKGPVIQPKPLKQ